MATETGVPLPKFGEWDVTNPASSEGFTVIFNKARDEKKIKKSTVTVLSPRKSNSGKKVETSQDTPKSKWFCCG